MFPYKRMIAEMLGRKQGWMRPMLSSSPLSSDKMLYETRRGKKKDSKQLEFDSLVRPVLVTPNSDDINVGAEMTESLKKADLQTILATFYQRKEILELSKEYGLTDELKLQAFNSFRRYCMEAEVLPVDLHIVLSDIFQGAGHITDIFPYFIRHAKEIFPHIECMDDLKHISDLRNPANWYPMARGTTRKIIFHAGPTNSGKTYHALERFRTAKSGVYCGPLKLLANEVFQSTNKLETPCDLITGEERQYSKGEDNPADHIACTVEMARLNVPCEVAVIDEIQMLKDCGRGWAWTRALLGIPADEIHLCGEASAVDLVRAICSTTGEDVEVRRYKRLSKLEIEKSALGSLKNVQPGDCIVCFNKNDIYTVSRELERSGIEVAIIYGSLPPNTKLIQAAKFNDPKNSCKVMVATDAIGMGLNLHIRRIIFYSMIKPTLNDKGEKEMDVISVSSALQIAGRAGRFGTEWAKGYVTTYKPDEHAILVDLLSKEPELITQAGLHPTADQIELYAYHLPKAALSNLMNIFVSLSTVDDSLYFICNIDDFKFLADMIQHICLPLRARYVFCCAPLNRKFPFPCTMFLKFARQYSKNEPITFNWLSRQIGWPLAPPKTIIDLVHLEAVFDILDLYLWLSYRFMDLFPDGSTVRYIQQEIDAIIQAGIHDLTKLLNNSETGFNSAATPASNQDDVQMNTLKQQQYKERKVEPLGQGKLTKHLLSQGLLTADMLRELQREWINDPMSSTSKLRRPPRKPKN